MVTMREATKHRDDCGCDGYLETLLLRYGRFKDFFLVGGGGGAMATKTQIGPECSNHHAQLANAF